MIKKIGTIKHFAVFENYNWDLSSTDKNGQPLKFEKINILYGRNYSGKTTLSRIFRSLETGQLPENYDNPQYELIDENGIKPIKIIYPIFLIRLGSLTRILSKET